MARDTQRLRTGIEYVGQGAARGAAGAAQQRFHAITADLTSPQACVDVMAEVTEWNGGSPPDIVWCWAGSANLTLFIETDVAMLQSQMDTNYWTGAYMAHAALKTWLRDDGSRRKGPSSTSPAGEPEGGGKVPPLTARHLIFTSSFGGLYSLIGYTPYSPAKAAIRSLSDTLSQELELYAAANPLAPRVKVHTVFPATILSEALEVENKIKRDVTKMLEEADDGQTPQEIARKSIAGLEGGQELIATDFQSRIVLSTMWGASRRSGFFRTLGDWLLACLGMLILIFVRWDMDRKVRGFGKQHGDSGMKSQ